MIIYGWDGSISGARPNFLNPPKIIPTVSTAGAADAASAKSLLDAMPSGRKTCFFQEGTHFNSFDDTDVADLFENGPYGTDMNTYWTDFGNKLVADGTELDFIVLDEETGHMGPSYILSGLSGAPAVAKVDEIWNVANALANVPKWVQDAVSASGGTSSFSTRDNNAAYEYTWQQWGLWRREEHFRENCQVPVETALGHSVKITNYRTYIPSFTIYSRFNTPKIRTTPSNQCSPVMYHYVRATAVNRYGSISKEIEWNTFIDQINVLAACTSVPGAKCVPWFGFRGWTGNGIGSSSNHDKKVHQWVWDRVLMAMGVMNIDEALYFNAFAAPNWDTRTDEDTQRIVDLHKSAPPEYYDKAPIPLDSESVTVGSHTWTYEQFQDEAL